MYKPYRSVQLVIIALLALLSFGFAGVAPVAAVGKDVPDSPQLQANQSIPGVPLTVAVLDGLSMAPYYDGRPQFFAESAGGTFLSVDSVVYGTHPSAGGNLNPVPFTPVSNGPVRGSGTASDPFSVTTVVAAGTTGVKLSQVTTYVNGDLFYHIDFTINNSSGSARSVRLIHGADLYINFPGNQQDYGFGFYDAPSGAVGALSEDGNSLQVFIPVTPVDAYQEASYGTFWSRIGTGSTVGPGLNNTINTSFHDAAAGLQWDRNVLAGGNVEISMDGAFGLMDTILAPPVEEEPVPANVSVVQRTSPSIAATPSSVVTYTIVATNRGDGVAREVAITMPFDPAKVRVLDASFSREGVWISNLSDGNLEIKTGSLQGNDSVTATVRLQVLPGVAPGTSLAGQLSYHWWDYAEGGDGRSNTTALVVDRSVQNPAAYPLSVDPTEGPAGTTFVFSSGLLAPKEPVGVWYNTPNGSVVAGPTYYAKEDGSLTVAFTDANLAPGTYSMVFYGHWTEITATTPFIVK